MVLGILAASIAALIACLGFVVGFSQYPDPDLGPRLAVAVGMGSAAAWAVASTCSSRNPLGNWFNLFAAVLAATSLGYLTPPEPFCRQITDSHGSPVRWKGESWLYSRACELRLLSRVSSTNAQTPPVAVARLQFEAGLTGRQVGSGMAQQEAR